MGAARGSLAAAVLVLSLLTACRRDDVSVVFRPRDGATFAYRVTVRSTTITEIGDEPPSRATDRVVLRVEQRVVGTGPEGTRMRMRVSGGGVDQELVVRLDRAAQLTAVERIEDFTPRLLGDVGLSAVFPAAAGAPPPRPLSPGEDWVVDTPLRLPGGEDTRLSGRGRLTSLGIIRGRSVATVDSQLSIPVHRVLEEAGGTVELTGRQSTSATTAHAIADGAVESARSTTTGEYRLRLVPELAAGAPAIPGRLTVEVRTTSRRTA